MADTPSNWHAAVPSRALWARGARLSERGASAIRFLQFPSSNLSHLRACTDYCWLNQWCCCCCLLQGPLSDIVRVPLNSRRQKTQSSGSTVWNKAAGQRIRHCQKLQSDCAHASTSKSQCVCMLWSCWQKVIHDQMCRQSVLPSRCCTIAVARQEHWLIWRAMSSNGTRLNERKATPRRKQTARYACARAYACVCVRLVFLCVDNCEWAGHENQRQNTKRDSPRNNFIFA